MKRTILFRVVTEIKNVTQESCGFFLSDVILQQPTRVQGRVDNSKRKELSTAIYYTSGPRGKSPTTTPNQIQHLHNLCISGSQLHSPAIPSIYVGHFSFHRATSIISRLCRTIHVNIYPYEIFMSADGIALQRYTYISISILYILYFSSRLRTLSETIFVLSTACTYMYI